MKSREKYYYKETFNVKRIHGKIFTNYNAR